MMASFNAKKVVLQSLTNYHVRLVRANISSLVILRTWIMDHFVYSIDSKVWKFLVRNMQSRFGKGIQSI